MTDLPNGWAWTTLENLLAVESRPITDGPFGSKLATRHYTASGARVVRLQNIGDGFFRDEKAFISNEYFEQLRDHEVRAGDLVLASLGEELPRVCIVPDLGAEAIVKADCIRARIHPRLDIRWVLYALMAPQTRGWASSRIKGVGRPRLGMAGIRQIPLPVPPLAEQRRIVVALQNQFSRLDVADLGMRRVARRLGLLVKRILVEAVPVPGPGHWKLVSVAEAGRVELGRQRHPDWHTGPHMRPYLRVANVFEDRIDTSDLMEMDFPADVFERYRLMEHDILLNEGQSPEYLGRPAMYRGIPENVAFTNSLLRFRVRPDVLPEWALLVFRRHMHAGRFMREVRITTNIAHLSATRLKSVEFPIPPLTEQERIVTEVREKLDSIQRFADAVEVGTKRAQGLRKSLLAEAFAGRLVEQDPADEPASVMLERIREERARQAPARRTRQSKGKRAPQKETLL